MKVGCIVDYFGGLGILYMHIDLNKSVRGYAIPDMGYRRLKGFGCLDAVNLGGKLLESRRFQGSNTQRDTGCW